MAPFVIGDSDLKKFLNLFLVLIIVFFALYFFLFNSELGRNDQKTGFKIGETVPGFSFTSISGVSGELKDFRGKVIVLNFWATFCEPCIKELPSLLELVEKMDGKVQLIAISGDSNLEDVNAFIKAFPKLTGKNVHLVWEKDQSILKRYQIMKLPETFVLDTELKFKKKVSGEVNWAGVEAIQFFNQMLNAKN